MTEYERRLLVEDEIDIRQLFAIVRRRLKWIISFTLLVALISGYLLTLKALILLTFKRFFDIISARVFTVSKGYPCTYPYYFIKRS
jgi:hypothetical protein